MFDDELLEKGERRRRASVMSSGEAKASNGNKKGERKTRVKGTYLSAPREITYSSEAHAEITD